MSRGLSEAEENALEALGMYLEERGVIDIDAEPKEKGAGWILTCKRKRGEIAYSAWGKTIQEAVTNVVKTVASSR